MKELIPFLMAGDPTLAATERLAHALVDEGVRTLELGVPFSDPLADGPVIQRSAQRALNQGTNLRAVLELCARLKNRTPDLRIILFSYLNPLLSLGIHAYTTQAKMHGVTATLAVDLPLEETSDYQEAHRAAGLETVFLAAPTTSATRLRSLAEASSPFLYIISRPGVTGEKPQFAPGLPAQMQLARECARVPLALGFGISSASQAKLAASMADHSVIGSKFLSLLDASSRITEAEGEFRQFARACLRAIQEIPGGPPCS